jgi:hypothetical protein
VIGHDIDRLLEQARLLHLHPGSGHREGLARHAEIGMTGIMPTPGLCRIQNKNRTPGQRDSNLMRHNL